MIELLRVESFTTNSRFCMKLVWLPGNHTNHIWPCLITGKNETQELIAWVTLVCFFTDWALWLLRLEWFSTTLIFCMKLVWLRGNNTNHIWTCMKSRKVGCMMGSPGIETNSSWNKIKYFLSSGRLLKPGTARIFYMKTKEGKVFMVAVKLANIQASRISKNETRNGKFWKLIIINCPSLGGARALVVFWITFFSGWEAWPWTAVRNCA